MAHKTKLTVRVDSDSLDSAKRYAAAHKTSLSTLVSMFLGNLPIQNTEAKRAPVLQKLSGILPADASIDEYRAHLSRKYDA